MAHAGLATDSHRLCVAPMMDWTDRHFRFFIRLISPSARLYTEMITAQAIIHGDRRRLLDFDASEHPLALQVGGSDPELLAQCAKIGEKWGYDEINLNCGCPSERVQQGAFGACLMAEPKLVADCVRRMQDATSLPVTVKHRIGIDHDEGYGLVQTFVGTLYEAGCSVFIVHARNAVLKGLSPKENREIPPLRLSVVRSLKRDFPQALFIANGGLDSVPKALAAINPDGSEPPADGVMIGRAAYHDPWVMHLMEPELFDHRQTLVQKRESILPRLQAYFDCERLKGVPARAMTRHWHGLFHGQPGARAWRREICLENDGPLALYERLTAYSDRFALESL